MIVKVFVGLILVCLASGIFSVTSSVRAGEDGVAATVIDINGDENTNIRDLELYWTSGYRYDYEDSLLVSKGESKLTIPINKIKEIEFVWDDETPTVTVTTLSGEKIKGEPLRVSNWYFKGKTDFGEFKLSVGKTKKVILAGGILTVASDVGADDDEVVATVIDINGDENTNIHDLELYWTSGYRYDYEDSLLVSKGESELTIPFNKIKGIEFVWDDEAPTVTVTTLSGEEIKGEPLRISNWYFKGKTDFGGFKLSVSKTKRVILSSETTPASPASSSVPTTFKPTLTPTSSPAATPALVPTPMTAQTPTSSPDQIPTPIPRPPGFETVFVLVAVLAVSLLIRWRQTK
jgi:hypothetical protein